MSLGQSYALMLLVCLAIDESGLIIHKGIIMHFLKAATFWSLANLAFISAF